MKHLTYILLICSLTLYSQDNSIGVKLISKTKIPNQTFIQLDNFGNRYQVAGNTISSDGIKGALEYTNIRLGTINYANVFNPLKISLFYKDFNSIVVLDNRLAEITTVDFNTLTPLRMVSKITAANDNSIWVYNENTLQLELFDVLQRQTKLSTLPLEGIPLDLTSNFNTCWLLTDTYLYTFSYFGSLLSKTQNEGFDMLRADNNDLYLKRKDTLYFKAEGSEAIRMIDLPKLLITHFFVIGESLYIYNGKILYQYQLLND